MRQEILRPLAVTALVATCLLTTAMPAEAQSAYIPASRSSPGTTHASSCWSASWTSSP